MVEQPGRVRIVNNGALEPIPFLDIEGRVGSGGERGLLGLAFHPNYAANGFFYVSFTDLAGNTRVERFAVSPDPSAADVSSAKLILGVGQPFSNHNGGLVAFGPDGMLYIGLGDGGSGGDQLAHGQNTGTLLGSLLRIDVDGGDPYAVPVDNPFIGQAGRDEIWGYGLRNPWRFSFDAVGGALYVADVGQNQWEEVNVVDRDQAGLNYGWNTMEGAHCFGSSTSSEQGLVLPAIEYSHSDGCSVTGGFVYRGSALPQLTGHYFYSDYCDGWLRSFRFSNGSVQDETEWDVGAVGQVLSFGQDRDGELYVLAAAGRVYRISGGN